MMNQENEIVRLGARVAALEKQNRVFKLTGLACLILLAFAFFASPRAYAQWKAPRKVPATISQDFALTDSQGRVRGDITLVRGMPVIRFYDAAGNLWWSAPQSVHVVGAAQ